MKNKSDMEFKEIARRIELKCQLVGLTIQEIKDLYGVISQSDENIGRIRMEDEDILREYFKSVTGLQLAPGGIKLV